MKTKKYHMSVDVNMCIWVEAENEEEAKTFSEQAVYNLNEHISSVGNIEIIDSEDISKVKKWSEDIK